MPSHSAADDRDTVAAETEGGGHGGGNFLCHGVGQAQFTAPAATAPGKGTDISLAQAAERDVDLKIESSAGIVGHERFASFVCRSNSFLLCSLSSTVNKEVLMLVE